jgi:hypothetical protein
MEKLNKYVIAAFGDLLGNHFLLEGRGYWLIMTLMEEVGRHLEYGLFYFLVICLILLLRGG